MKIISTALLLGFSAFGADAQTPGQLPPAPTGTPKAGEKAPDFTLPDKNEKPMKLSELLMAPAAQGAEKSGQWALLVFYRGYW